MDIQLSVHKVDLFANCYWKSWNIVIQQLELVFSIVYLQITEIPAIVVLERVLLITCSLTPVVTVCWKTVLCRR